MLKLLGAQPSVVSPLRILELHFSSFHQLLTAPVFETIHWEPLFDP